MATELEKTTFSQATNSYFWLSSLPKYYWSAQTTLGSKKAFSMKGSKSNFEKHERNPFFSPNLCFIGLFRSNLLPWFY